MPCIHRWCVVLFAICLLQFARCEDPRNAETERLRNTPPELTSVGGNPALPGQAQARFLPFSASFSLSAGGNNAQTFSIAGSPDGIGLSQSSSHGSAGVNGNPGSFSASQSSSIAAGLNGISTSDSNAFAANHPFYGPTAQSNTNSFAVGQAAASAHGDVVNGQAVSGAQSSVGGTHTQASSSANAAAASGANHQNLIQLRPERPSAWGNTPPNYASGNGGDYYYNSQGKPSLTITVSDDRNRFGIKPSNGWYEVPETPSREPWRRPAYCDQYNGWYRDPRCRSPKVVVTKPTYRPSRPVYFANTRDPRQEGGKVQISAASAASSAQSRPGGLSIGQSSAQSQSSGNRQPGTLTINRVETSGNAQAHAQGTAGSVHHHHLGRPGNLQASLSSGSASASSRPGGFAQGSSVSSSSGGNSNSQVNAASGGGGSAHGSASAGSVVTFPGPSSAHQIIPKEFIRSKRPKDEDEFDELLTDLTDTVYEILDV